MSPAHSDDEMHAVQRTPSGWLQENRAPSKTKFLWAAAFSECDHHQPNCTIVLERGWERKKNVSILAKKILEKNQINHRISYKKNRIMEQPIGFIGVPNIKMKDCS